MRRSTLNGTVLYFGACLTGAGLVLTACPALAQGTGAGTGLPAPEGLQEIIVTAQKRAQNLQDVGVSMTALDSDALAALGKTGMIGLAAQVPSVQINTWSQTETVFNIRGVSQNDFADSQEAPIAFYNDEVYIGALGAIAGQMFDLQRVEILRGPQGTLFGRNATGGLIQVVSAKPTDAPEGFLTTSFGSYNQIGTEGAVSGALTDSIKARLSVSTDNHDGYIHNTIGPDLNNANFSAVRLQLEAKIGAEGDLLVKVEGLRNNHEVSGNYSFESVYPDSQGLGQFLAANQNYWGTCPGCNIEGYKTANTNPYVGAYNSRGLFDRSYLNNEIHYTQPIGNVTLTAITDYQYLHKRYFEDTDASPISLFEYGTRQNLGQGSQEIRLSEDVGKLTWVAGLYGLYIDTSNNYNVFIDPALSPSYFYHSHTRTASAAAFEQTEYSVTDQWKAILGLRYSDDWKNYTYRNQGTDGSFFSISPETDGRYTKEKFGNYSGKVELDYKPTQEQLYYVSVNRGTKSGGFGTPSSTPVDPTTLPFKQEVLTNYEAGEKIAILNNTTSLDGAVFYYDYHDYQAFSSQGLSQFVTNHDATVKGAELEVKTVPLHGLHLQAFGTYLNTNVKDITLPDGEVTDRQMPQAPRFSFGGSARYDIDSDNGLFGFQTDWRWDGDNYFAVFNAPIDLEHAHLVGNLRLTYTPEQQPWEAAFFINNVTGKRYRTYDLDVSSLSIANSAYAPPRWFGGSLTYRF